ncbi:small, acid-soluble spore beta domain protein, partial [Clostridioides difficile Y184]
MSNSNRTVVPEAKAALNQMKLEIANEIGLSNYENIDKGNLTARENGYVGGYMTKKLVEMAERQMAGKLKIDHIREMCEMDRIKNIWSDKFGKVPTEDDVNEL